MQRNKLPDLVLYYKPIAKRIGGRLKKSWKDQFLYKSSWNKLYKHRMQLVKKNMKTY
jgi:hypothetical protein